MSTTTLTFNEAWSSGPQVWLLEEGNVGVELMYLWAMGQATSLQDLEDRLIARFPKTCLLMRDNHKALLKFWTERYKLTAPRTKHPPEVIERTLDRFKELALAGTNTGRRSGLSKYYMQILSKDTWEEKPLSSMHRSSGKTQCLVPDRWTKRKVFHPHFTASMGKLGEVDVRIARISGRRNRKFWIGFCFAQRDLTAQKCAELQKLPFTHWSEATIPRTVLKVDAAFELIMFMPETAIEARIRQTVRAVNSGPLSDNARSIKSSKQIELLRQMSDWLEANGIPCTYLEENRIGL